MMRQGCERHVRSDRYGDTGGPVPAVSSRGLGAWRCMQPVGEGARIVVSSDFGLRGLVLLHKDNVGVWPLKVRSRSGPRRDINGLYCEGPAPPGARRWLAIGRVTAS